MSNAIVLVRVSTKTQAESETGILAQIAACSDYAKKNNLQVVEIIQELGVSGAAGLDSRNGLIRALSLLETGGTLLVAKYDRLSRSLLNQLLIEKAVRSKKAKIVAVDNENAADNDPSSVLLRRLLSSVAEYEREIIKGRVKQAHKTRKRAGLTCGHPPYGFSVGQDGVLVVNDQEKEIWDLVSTLRATPLGGKKSHPWRIIAEKLNEQGYTNRSGNSWKWENLYQIQRTKKEYQALQ